MCSSAQISLPLILLSSRICSNIQNPLCLRRIAAGGEIIAIRWYETQRSASWEENAVLLENDIRKPVLIKKK
jgi:hypothetical protein